MSPDAIRAKIVATLPDAVVELEDLTGTADHWKASIVSAAFVGKTAMQRHRIINAILADELRGPIHALSMDTRTPDEAAG